MLIVLFHLANLTSLCVGVLWPTAEQCATTPASRSATLKDHFWKATWLLFAIGVVVTSWIGYQQYRVDHRFQLVSERGGTAAMWDQFNQRMCRVSIDASQRIQCGQSVP